MSTTATTSTWKSPSHSHSHSSSRSSRPSTTPRAPYPSTSSVGQSRPPKLSPHAKSPQISRSSGLQSPNYFGFVVGDDSIPPDSGPGMHTKQNWNMTSDSPRQSTKPMSNERNPEFEMFRRESDKGLSFNLGNLSTPKLVLPNGGSDRGERSPVSPTSKPSQASSTFKSEREYQSMHPKNNHHPFFPSIVQQDSPMSMSPRHSVSDHQHARLSLPASELQGQLENLKTQRSETLPSSHSKDTVSMASPIEIASLLEEFPQQVLLLDLRVYPQYAASRIRGALNLCIPTTLLKRPAYTVQKLAETFTSEADREKFNRWSDARYIIVYDATSSLAKEAIICFNVLKKFSTEGWKGRGLVVKGGFQAFKQSASRLIDQGATTSGKGVSTAPMAISPPNHDKLAVAGGCAMPSTKNAANPFFGNIRQNMDLLDGVGQMPIKRPADMTSSEEKAFPSWLNKAASSSDEGKIVSDKFLRIEKSEQKRMQQALSNEVSYEFPKNTSDNVQVAGIEKGSKNRYNNIFPFEHSRVHLQNVPSHGCDYINASFVQAAYSNRKYIATQAPIPSTFDDFWRAIWEQDARVIVMLTAESEGGQIKSHPYWKTGEYGQIKVRQLSEKTVSLDKCTHGNKDNSGSSGNSKHHNRSRPALGARRLTTSNTTPTTEKKLEEVTRTPVEPEKPVVVVRQFSVSHSAQPFQPRRDIVQLHYSQWPDFGAPASPSSIIGLIELVNKYQRSSSDAAHSYRSTEPAPEGQRPIVVHCSAGCGRTGTFCTVDSVIDMLKRQRIERLNHDADRMAVDVKDDWVTRDDVDLVAKAVDDFRHQRLSMVQNLRQFVLCYESIIQWLHEDTSSARDGRRSYHG